jgi:hypothetical protein
MNFFERLNQRPIVEISLFSVSQVSKVWIRLTHASANLLRQAFDIIR